MEYSMNAIEVGYINAGDFEVKVYRDSEGSLSAEIYYCGLVQTRLGKGMIKLLMTSLEMADH
jgi:hypothetical protein